MLAKTFNDYLLIPQYSDIDSRDEVSLDTYLTPTRIYSLPVMSAPMTTVTDGYFAEAFTKLGGYPIIHRYMSIEKRIEQSLMAGSACVAIGCNELDSLDAFIQKGITDFCLDVAHAHTKLVGETLKEIKRRHPQVFVIAGNVATLDGYEFLCDHGADMIRVGIGGGSICTTRIQTGHGVPTLHSVFQCASSTYGVPFIADGGLKSTGDMTKALAAGASFVMLGSYLAGVTEAPGSIWEENGIQYKMYEGMASKEAQQKWRGSVRSVEGVSHRVKYKGDLADLVGELAMNLKSGLSYSGARTIKELQDTANWLEISGQAYNESVAHIYNH